MLYRCFPSGLIQMLNTSHNKHQLGENKIKYGTLDCV